MQSKRKRIWWITIVSVLIVAVAVTVVIKSGKKKTQGPTTVKVERRNIEDKALAVGTIDPETEFEIKSKISGVVKTIFVEAGSFVKAGDPLVEIRPDPTPLELAEAKRNVEMSTISTDNAKKEYERSRQLKDKGLVSQQQFETLEKQYQEAKLRDEMSRERLALLEKGKIAIAKTNIESIIKAPTSGFILERKIDVGDPIVPLTSYQAGTGIFTMADMSEMLFKGTVDEIDVGKLKEGMTAEIQVGALPGKPVKGKLERISLKAQKVDNTCVFPVEITLEPTEGAQLRAGYSANAHIIIMKKDSVLSVPERVVTFRNDSAFVNIPKPDGTKKEVYIKTGLSDAINIEIIDGLKEGEEVLEKEVKEIT
jgi:HlyD family secretion protein